MTDQVNSINGLASGLPATVVATATAVSPSGVGRPAKTADPASQGPENPAAIKSTDSPAKAAEQINSHLQHAETQLRIQVDAQTGRAVYKVMDPATGQVVLQVPSEQILAMAHSLQSVDKSAGSSGLLLDKKG
jgi:flagellar protein FlaG